MTEADQRRRLSAALRPRNYRAAVNTVRLFERPIDALSRYVRSSGDYPWRPVLRTPTGKVVLTVPHPHDGRTVNEVFCRGDYRSATAPRVVVDIGANIGISASYFLTRRPESVVYAFEPVPHNIATLKANLAQFAGRWHLSEVALAPRAGTATFLTEPIGRYSGLASYIDIVGNRTETTVRCEAIASALESVIATEGHIDLVKIDTEGSEEALVAAIPDDLWPHLGALAYEAPGGIKWVHRSRSQ